MTAEESFKQHFPANEIKADEIAIIKWAEQYANERLKDFASGLTNLVQYNSATVVAQIKEATKHF